MSDALQALESIVDAFVVLYFPSYSSGPSQLRHHVDSGLGEDPHALHAEGDQNKTLPGALLPHQPQLAFGREGRGRARGLYIFSR